MTAPFMQGYLRGTFHSGSAGLFTTVYDYWRFAQMLLNEGELDGHRILHAESVQEMSRNQIGSLPFAGVRAVEYAANTGSAHAGLGYGYGVAVVTDAQAAGIGLPTGSYGWDGIGTRRFWVIPHGQAILVMVTPSSHPGGADNTHREIEQIVSQALNR
jgi:CubicO group peptidase (beta-lactamase class C family)